MNCIQVDDEDYANNQVEWEKDEHTVYSEDCSLGIDDFDTNELLMYPNPVATTLYIVTQQPIYSLQVFDIKGQLILQRKEGTRQLDLSEWSTGIYFLQVETDSGILFQKILKQ